MSGDARQKDPRIRVTFSAFDSATGNPVPAVFYVNGIRAAGETLLLPGSSVMVQAVHPGYQPMVQPLIVTPGLQGSLDFFLTPASSRVVILIQTAPPVPGAMVKISGESGTQDLAADQEGKVRALVDPGPYVVEARASGYATGSIAINARAGGRYDVQMVREKASGSESGTNRTWMDLPQPAVAENPAETLPALDSLAPVYFTSAQCRLYIGRLLIDELQSIRWLVQANVIPVYGYASQFADAFARGRSQVQGELVINYVHPGYLFAAVRNEQVFGPLPPPENLSGQFLQKYAELDEQRTFRAGRRYPIPANPLYLNSAFDMRLEIGDGPWRGSRFLERCVLISNELIVAQDGQPVAEAYGFIARRAR